MAHALEIFDLVFLLHALLLGSVLHLSLPHLLYVLEGCVPTLFRLELHPLFSSCKEKAERNPLLRKKRSIKGRRYLLCVVQKALKLV